MDSNLRMAVYVLSAINGDERLMLRFLNKYKGDETPENKIKALQALGFFEESALISKALAISIGKDVRPQDSIIVYVTTAGNPKAQRIFWEWEKKNWKKIMGMFAVGTKLDDYVEGCASFHEKEMRDDFAAFFSRKENRRGDIERAIARTLENIDANIVMMERNTERKD